VDYKTCTISESFLPTLYACVARERAEEVDVSPSRRLAICGTPMEAEVFKMNSPLLIKMLGEKTSRKKMHDLAERWVTLPRVETDDCLLVDGHEVDWCIYPLDVSMRTYTDTQRLMKDLKILKIVPVVRESHHYPYRTNFAPSGFELSMSAAFERSYLPRVMGGSSDVKPSSYVESESVFKQGLKDLCSRKQVFTIVIREQDEKKPLIVKLLLSNFMEGCRALLGNSDSRPVREPMEELIAPIASELLDPKLCHPPLDGPMVSIFDSYFPAAYHQGQIGKLDISDLILASVNNKGTKVFQDMQVMMAFWWRMKKTFLDSQVLVINPRRMNYWEDEREYQSAGMTRLYVRRLIGASQELVGNEVIVQEGSVYKHYWTVWSGTSIYTPPSTPVDTYQIEYLSSEPHVRITLSTIKGYICVVAFGSHVIDVICLSEPEQKSTIKMYTDGAILARPDTLSRLDIMSEAQISASRRVKFYYQFFEGLSPDDTEELEFPQTQDENELDKDDYVAQLDALIDQDMEANMLALAEEENELIDDRDIMADFSDLDSDYDPFGGTGPSKARAESTMGSDVESGDGISDDSGSGYHEIKKIPLGSAVTRTSAYVQRLDLAGVLVANDFNVTSEMVNGRWKTIYSLEVPVEGYDLSFDTEDQIEPVEKVVNFLESKGDAESKWVLSYFKDSLRMNRVFSVITRSFGFR
jgi:hypothetical protein